LAREGATTPLTTSKAELSAIIAQSSRIAAFAAHPDDLEYYAGGTLALCAANGADICAVIATDGELGGVSADIRRTEQREAAAILGYRRVIFLGFPDRGLRTRSAALVETVAAILDDIRPDTVLTFDNETPKGPYIHSDHQAIASAVWASCTQSANPLRLLLFNSRRPNMAVDVRPVMKRKIFALRAHQTQMEGAQLPRLLRPVWRWSGRRTGFPLAASAERFRLVAAFGESSRQ
jgi:LmbE family N-acetylglucosaminyl deacetylase